MKEVYEQVMITCTTINVVIILSTLFSWIGIKVSDRRRKKKEEAEKRKQENNDQGRWAAGIPSLPPCFESR